MFISFVTGFTLKLVFTRKQDSRKKIPGQTFENSKLFSSQTKTRHKNIDNICTFKA